MIVRARAPLRLGLAGGGTDVAPYSDEFGGFVMNATIDKHAYVTIEPSDDVTFHALDRGTRSSYAPGAVRPDPGDTLLHAGVYLRISRDFLDGRQPPLVMYSYSDAPPGSGLGSSSTLVVALVTAMVEYFSLPLGEYEIARLAFEVERIDLGLKGGKQDQYAAAFGGFNFMEFHAADRVIVNPLRVKDRIRAEMESCLMLYFTGVSRESARIIDEQARNAAVHKESSLSAMHALKAEAVQMKEAVLRGDLALFAQTLQKGWEEKKKMADSITNPFLNALEASARANGAIAAKLSGAGGGGYMMFVCDPKDRIRLRSALAEQGGQVVDFHFSQEGAVAWTV